MINQAAKKSLTNNFISIVELFNLLAANRQHIILNFHNLQENYQYQHIRQVIGTRDIDGNLIQPWLKAEDIDKNEYVQITSFSLNRHTASLNMLIQRQVRLINTQDATPITEVAGLLTNQLNRFNNYTVVSDGKFNIREIKVKISSKKTFELLHQSDIITDSEFDFRREYTINLDKFPIVDLEQPYQTIDGVFQKLAEAKVLVSIISAHLKQESDVFLAEQLDSLAQHHLSKQVYLNFPKTKESSESIQMRTIHKIDIGNKDILNLSKFHSANKFLNRMYCGYDIETGEVLKKLDFGMAILTNVAFQCKPISSRMKITEVDQFMKLIFDDFLGFSNCGIVTEILTRVGDRYLIQLLQEKRQGKHASKSEMVAALTAANTMLGQYIESIYREIISPLVFYIGSTGLLPKNMETTAMNSQQLAEKYPNLQFSPNEKHGKFFEVGDSIVSIYSQTELYSQKTDMTVLK
ncbi:hypothetical protein [Calothrix sp. PCC 6303]|uniref:hypothetical protein n=1 Tax=Calothrix sp. PCC 6303 TaxID=1170562 RepID=UPI0002A02306|nr:hypothetical protein [Calothrix sp. PCC 6303]AFZ00444.1 hypothetical protein Cal6303_1391 [Calothrix sp. PCC 6303]